MVVRCDASGEPEPPSRTRYWQQRVANLASHTNLCRSSTEGRAQSAELTHRTLPAVPAAWVARPNAERVSSLASCANLTMDSNNMTEDFHTAPLWWLVKHKLHDGQPLAERVRAMRARRRWRSAPAVAVEEQAEEAISQEELNEPQ